MKSRMSVNLENGEYRNYKYFASGKYLLSHYPDFVQIARQTLLMPTVSRRKTGSLFCCSDHINLPTQKVFESVASADQFCFSIDDQNFGWS